MVSVPAYEPAGPSLNLGIFSSVKSRNVKNENVQDIRSVQREEGIGAAVGESPTISRYFSCSQSRTFPMYIAL